MTISRNVFNQLFDGESGKEQVIRLRPTEAKAGAVVVSAKSKIKMWTKDEHERFLAALEKFPSGPWKKVADYIGTKTPRQTMTHAQKYRQKIHRRQRGLRNQKKTPPATEGATPAPVDTAAAVKEEGKDLVSPYGVADLQLKQDTPKGETPTNDQLLNILAQQATTIQDKTPTQDVETATSATDADAEAGQNLPSLAEILHLSGKEGEEKDEKESKDESDKKEQPKPTECKCNCKCGAHDVKMDSVEEATQPRPEAQEEALI